MTIKRYFTVFFLVLFVLIIANISAFFVYQKSELHHDSLQKDRLAVMELSSIIRDTSNKLTRTTRTYIVTGDETYADYYNEIIAFRNGVRPRPENYFSVYWDRMHTDQEGQVNRKEPIEKLISRLITPRRYLEQLKTATDLSFAISKFELQAIQLYKSGKEVNRERALDMVYGMDYLKAKSEIMSHIDSFEDEYDLWHFEENEILQKNIMFAKIALLLLQVLLIAALMSIRYFILKNVSSPLSQLSHFSKRISSGDFNNRIEINTETSDINWLVRSMNQMQDNITKTLNQYEQQTNLANKAKVQAQAANKTRGEFLANMSHEIRTPMNGIIGLSQLLQEQSLPQKEKIYVDKILLSARQLLEILNDILDFSKIDSDKLTIENIDFNLNGIFDRISNVLAVQAHHKKLEFNFDMPANFNSRFYGDPIRLTQILMNLCSNAIKFTKEGQIVLSVRNKQINGKDGVQFAVSDTGVGLTEDQMKRIFDPFSQADNSITRNYGGSGLGLSICKNLAELMDGSIGLTSKIGVGSTFTVTVPVLKKRRKKKLSFKQKEIMLFSNSTHDQELIAHNGRTHNLHVKLYDTEQLFHPSMVVDKPTLVVIDLHTFESDQQAEIAHLNKDWLMDSNVQLLILPNIVQIGCAELFSYKEDLTTVYRPFLFKDILKVIRLHKVEKSIKDSSAIFGGLKILLAEDFKLNQIVAKGLLEKLGVSVDIVENGQEAVDAVKTGKYSLVFMDVHMPIMDGHKATKLIREISEFEHLPIIALTADAQHEHIQKCLKSGMDDFLSKPFLLADIEKIMLKHIS